MGLTRRAVLASIAAAASAAPKKKPPVGLELYSVRGELQKDMMATVTRVGKMGYDGVEFYAPYIEWTPAQARDMRKLLDDLGIRCFSTHTRAGTFADALDKAIELNTILGSRFIIMSSAGKVESLDGWKTVAERLNQAAGKMKPAGLRTGFHNHQVEFKPIDGTRPMDVLAKNTEKSVVLQLDLGTCVEAGSDPVAWIKANPGRIASLHCKEWARDARGYRVLPGEGAVPWKQVFQAAEKVGGVEYYLVEQEGADYPEFEAAERSLKLFRQLHG